MLFYITYVILDIIYVKKVKYDINNYLNTHKYTHLNTHVLILI